MEKLKVFTQETLLPISFVILLFGAVFFIGRLTNKVENNEVGLVKAQEQLNAVPTRQEFDVLRSDVVEIKGDIKSLLRR